MAAKPDLGLIATTGTDGGQRSWCGLALAFKLILAAQQRWRRVNAPYLVALARAGVKFKDGVAQLTPLPREQPPIHLEDSPVGIATMPVPIHNI